MLIVKDWRDDLDEEEEFGFEYASPMPNYTDVPDSELFERSGFVLSDLRRSGRSDPSCSPAPPFSSSFSARMSYGMDGGSSKPGRYSQPDMQQYRLSSGDSRQRYG
jgi:hypothetical protein